MHTPSALLDAGKCIRRSWFSSIPFHLNLGKYQPDENRADFVIDPNKMLHREILMVAVFVELVLSGFFADRDEVVIAN